jgi:tetratricopeptide (TPR) repeat protein
MIITFITFILKKLKTAPILLSAILASYICYLVQNIFGFSVVIIAIFFYLFPAIAFVATDSMKQFQISNFKFPISNLIYRRETYTKATKIFLFLTTCYFLVSLVTLWWADILYARGDRLNQQGNIGQAYNYILEASELNKIEPLYKSDLGYAAAASALALQETDATLSAILKNQATYETANTLLKHPNNTSFWRTAFRTYLQLSDLDPQFEQLTLDVIDSTIDLAPTDPKLPYHKGLILDDFGRSDEAIRSIQQAIDLKPNYREPLITLAQLQFKNGQTAQAVATIKEVLEFIPDDPEVIEQLNQWGSQGIATESAQPQ